MGVVIPRSGFAGSLEIKAFLPSFPSDSSYFTHHCAATGLGSGGRRLLEALMVCRDAHKLLQRVHHRGHDTLWRRIQRL
jgi:hypothetical protein